MYINQGDGKVDPMAGSTAALLHNKVDKVIRVVDQTSENQKKMNKVLQDLIKFGGLISKDQGIALHDQCFSVWGGEVQNVRILAV